MKSISTINKKKKCRRDFSLRHRRVLTALCRCWLERDVPRWRVGDDPAVERVFQARVVALGKLGDVAASRNQELPVRLQDAKRLGHRNEVAPDCDYGIERRRLERKFCGITGNMLGHPAAFAEDASHPLNHTLDSFRILENERVDVERGDHPVRTEALLPPDVMRNRARTDDQHLLAGLQTDALRRLVVFEEGELHRVEEVRPQNPKVDTAEDNPIAEPRNGITTIRVFPRVIGREPIQHSEEKRRSHISEDQLGRCSVDPLVPPEKVADALVALDLPHDLHETAPPNPPRLQWHEEH